MIMETGSLRECLVDFSNTGVSAKLIIHMYGNTLESWILSFENRWSQTAGRWGEISWVV